MADAPKQKMGAGGLLVILALAAIFIFSLYFAYWGWNINDAEISTHGMTALVAGIVLSTALGAGLMALLFWSNRKGYDR